jgi:hypothetical protein
MWLLLSKRRWRIVQGSEVETFRMLYEVEGFPAICFRKDRRQFSGGQMPEDKGQRTELEVVIRPPARRGHRAYAPEGMRKKEKMKK